MRGDEHEYDIGRLKTKQFPRGEFVLTFWRDGKRSRHRLGTDNEASARRIAPSVFATAVKPKGSKIGDLWSAYLIDNKEKPVTKIMPHQWKALAPFFADVPAEMVTVALCRSYTKHRRTMGRKDNTIITELGRVRTVMNWARKNGFIEVAPHVERPEGVRRVERHLTRTEVNRLVEACAMPHLALFVRVAYATAGRAGAIFGLTWDRCDFERNKIDLEDPMLQVRHKGRAIVPMGPGLKRVLLEAKEGARSPFVIEWDGQRIASVRTGLTHAATKAKLGHVHPHLLRHSAAVQMAESGFDMEEIRAYLGHENVNVTRKIYARFSPNHLRDLAAVLDLD